MRGAEAREPEEQHEVRGRLGQDLHGLDDGEFHRLVLLPELGEEDGRQAVAEEDAGDVGDHCAEARVAEGGGDRPGEGDHDREEGRVQAEDREEGVGIHRLRVGVLLVGEAEAARFQPEDQNDLEDGDIGHELRDDPVFGLGQHPRVDRDEQEIQDPRQDGTEAVHGGLARQFLQRICHNQCKIS